MARNFQKLGVDGGAFLHVRPGTMTSCRLPLVPSMMVTVCVPDAALAAARGIGAVIARRARGGSVRRQSCLPFRGWIGHHDRGRLAAERVVGDHRPEHEDGNEQPKHARGRLRQRNRRQEAPGSAQMRSLPILSCPRGAFRSSVVTEPSRIIQTQISTRPRQLRPASPEKQSGRPLGRPGACQVRLRCEPYCGSAARFGFGGKAEFDTTPRSRSAAILSALSSFGSGGI